MKKTVYRYVLYIAIASVAHGCVSSKVFNDLETRFENLQEEKQHLSDEVGVLREENQQYEQQLRELRSELEDLSREHQKLQGRLQSTQENYEKLQTSYDALEANSSSALAENSQRNRQLLKELEAKEKALRSEKQRLEELEDDLDERSRRINELERLVAAKDAKMRALKEAISSALVNFEGKGLTVEQRDGKVYVSMENKLLFSSGSWTLGAEGKEAVRQLGSVLAMNPDIAVLIEGHTDNVPYNGNGPLRDNWDLSTKRATTIVQLLKEVPGIHPENLTAAGRGEHAPVATNETAEGRAKNRRIEVILTPRLDEVDRLLNDAP